MDARALGVTLMIVGAAVVAGGWLLASGWLGWFGRLPGDIRVASALTLIANVLRRLL